MPETTIPPGAALLRDLGAYLRAESGEDQADALVDLARAAARIAAHPAWHLPADDASGVDDAALVLGRQLTDAAVDDDALWKLVNGPEAVPCARRLAAHGPLMDTPPARDGDTDGLCRDCRHARARTAIHAAGAELVDLGRQHLHPIDAGTVETIRVGGGSR